MSSRRKMIGRWLRSWTSATSFGIRWRIVTVAGLLLAAWTLYITLFVLLYRGRHDRELYFGVAGSVQALNLYLDVVSLDPVRESLSLSIEIVKPSESQWWRSFKLEEENNLVIDLDDHNYDYKVTAKESRAKAVREVSLDGSINGYPLDHYTGRISIKASNKITGAAVPIRLTVWPLLSDWDVRINRSGQALKNSFPVDLTIRAKRPTSFIVMTFALYVAMALIGLSALTIGTLVFLGVRPLLEEGMLGALGAMIFAIPALRGIMPGTPPLGIFADILVLLWAQMAAIIGLTLFVVTWVLRPRTAAGHD